MKISVIVPVYNAEKYLDRCIESVVAQTYTDWEMIMVDDGSSDGSADIIDARAAQDKRIIAIHQQNSGAGVARNNGIDAATGDYIVFLDSDDYIDKEYFSLLLPKALENDVVLIDNDQVSADGRLIRQEKMSVYKDYDKDQFLRSQMTGKISWGGWRKAVSMSLLKNNGIKYTTHSIGEEALYSFRVLHAAKNIVFLDERSVYFYVNHDDSLSRSKNTDPWGDVAETIAEHLKENGLYEQYADTVNAFRVTAFVVSLDRIAQYFKGAEYKAEISKRKERFRSTYDYTVGIDKGSMSYKAKTFLPFVMRGIVFPVAWASKLRRLGKKST